MNLLKYENELMEKGYTIIAGVDEVGLGASAGALVACAVANDAKGFKALSKIHFRNYRVNDSKVVPKEIRDILYKRILRSVLAVGIGIVDVSEILYLRNIRKAGYLARYRAVQNLARSSNLHSHLHWHPKDQNLEYAIKLKMLYTPVVPRVILVDGPFGMPEIKDTAIKSIIGGDRRSISIASASIIAKVFRDTLMKNLHQIHPHYGWDTNMGYCTKFHTQAIWRYGLTPYHRKYYKYIRKALSPELPFEESNG